MEKQKFQNSQGKPITIPAGDHGISVVKVGAKVEVRCLPGESITQTVLRAELPRESAAAVAGRNYAESETRAEVHRESLVEFICFGKSHLYLVEWYPIVAPYWRDRLLAEAYILDDSLRYDQKIAEEILHNKSVIGLVVRAGAAVKDVFTGRTNVPSPDEYEGLRKRVDTTRRALAGSTAADYALLHESGVEFARITSDQKSLNDRVHGRVSQLVSAAETGEKVSGHIEEASFWILDIYGQVVARDPLRLFAYRFAVLTVQAGAHAAGTGISGGNAREAFREAGKVVFQKLPAASTGLVLGLWKKGPSVPGEESILRTAAEQSIGVTIFVFFFAIDYYLFEADEVPPEQRTDVLLERLAPKLAEQIVSAVGAIVTHKVASGLPYGSPQRKQVERLGAVIPTLITSIMSEIARMQAKAKAERRPFHDVFSAEAGWALVTVVQAVGQAWMQDSIRSRMDVEHAQNTDQLTKWIKELFSRHSEAPEPPKPHVAQEPEEQPRKKNGAAALKPRPEDPAEPLAKKPPKPDRKQIRAVAKTPRHLRVVPSESELQELVPRLGPAYTPAQLEKSVKDGKVRLPGTKGGKGTFVVPVKVRDADGNVVAEWYEVGKGGRGRPRGPLYAQHLALARISTGHVEVGGKKISVDMDDGWTVEFAEPYSGSKYNPDSDSAVAGAPKTKVDASGLEDIKDRFRYTTRGDADGKTIKEVSGKLGVPGKVVQHRSESSQRGVSSGSGDDAGHLIGNRFGASGGQENLSRQNWIQNEGGGTFHDLENRWEARLKSGVEIEATVQDITRPGETRPFMRRVVWKETDQAGRVTEDKLIFANPHTEDSREKQGIPATALPPDHLASVSSMSEYRMRTGR